MSYDRRAGADGAKSDGLDHFARMLTFTVHVSLLGLHSDLVLRDKSGL